MPSQPIQSSLDDTYFAAVYTVQTPRPLAFRFDPAGSPGSGDRLPFREPWGIITACNPRSRALSESENQTRDHQLVGTLRSMGHAERLQRTIASDTTGGWREPGWLVESVTRPDLLALSRRFEQHAVVFGDGGETGLLFTDTERWIVRPIVIVTPRSDDRSRAGAAHPPPR